MSNRSYPAGFQRPLRKTPVVDDAEWAAMMDRLRRRSKIGKTSSQQAHDEARSRVELSFDLAPASSADTPTSAGGLHVSATADKTACAGGGSNGVSCDSGSPFQPTRPSLPVVKTQAHRQEHGPGSGCGDFPEFSPGSPIAPSVPALIWERISPTAMRTTCGTWTCCKVIVMGKPQYELFRRIAGLERPTRVLPSFETFADASKAAQDELAHVG